MADGAVTYTVTVDAETAERFDAAARKAGVAPEAYVVELIEGSVGPAEMSESAFAYQHEQARIALEDYDRTGVAYPLEESLDRFDAALNKALAAKR